MKIMARITLALFVLVFATANAGAVGVLVPKDMNEQERQAYIAWKMAALKSAGVIQQDDQADATVQGGNIVAKASAPATTTSPTE